MNRSEGVGRRGGEHLKIAVILLLALMLCLLLICAPPDVMAAAEKDQPPKGDAQALQFSKDRDIQQIKPKKPVRIKLHRNAKGEYVWDITGDNVDDVIRADRRLKKLLNLE